MQIIYHLIPQTVWEQTTDPYEAETLSTEGFIHCSSIEQLPVVANLFYREVPNLLALRIDAEALGDLVKYEKAALPPELEKVAELREDFPHVYGPIPRSAIVSAVAMKKNAAGDWTLSE